jgi:hypothetical protein
VTTGIQKDNSTYAYKVALRREALARLADLGVTQPVVMETHGGAGALFNRLYAHLEQGVVFEKDSTKSAKLGKQRPTWAVYEADCIEALKAGVGAHLTIDLLDVDPYGQAWDVIEAFFTSVRPWAKVMAVAVNDGLRQKLALGGAWAVGTMQRVVEKYGNDLHPVYLEVCADLMEEKAAYAGYRVSHFAGYHCGDKLALTHYLAILERDGC